MATKSKTAKKKAKAPAKKAAGNGDGSSRVKLLVDTNERREGTSAHARVNEMIRFLKKNPRATKEELLSKTSYHSRDLAWDVERERVALSK